MRPTSRRDGRRRNRGRRSRARRRTICRGATRSCPASADSSAIRIGEAPTISERVAGAGPLETADEHELIQERADDAEEDEAEPVGTGEGRPLARRRNHGDETRRRSSDMPHRVEGDLGKIPERDLDQRKIRAPDEDHQQQQAVQAVKAMQVES